MRRLFAIAALCLACHRSPAEQQPDGGILPDGGHALPGPGFAAAWKIEDPNELITGPSTGGRKGDWEIANSRVRFVVEDARPSDGYDPYGCSIAAADRQRDAGLPGESRWGEVWIGLNFRAAECTGITVVNDGRDGEPAVLRATGHDAESPFMASIFAVSAQPAPLHATIYREYSLAPDTDAMLVNLTIQNDGDSTLDITAPYIGMAMNRGLRHWVDKSGFDFDFSDLARVNTSAQFYAAVGEKISYSVLELHASFSPILNFAHVLIGQYPQIHIPAGQSDTFRFAIGVGTGDVGSLQAAHAEVASIGDSLLSGTVADAAGNPVAGARVHVTDTTGLSVVSFVRTAADGSWSARVLPGSYSVRAVADDRTGSAAQAITVPSTGLLGVNLTVGGQSVINATATDKDAHPIPAKIVLEPVSAPRPTLPAAMGEMWDKQPIVVFSADGKATVPVYPGTWHVTFSRGFEYDRPAVDVAALPGGNASASETLRRVIDTSGWISGDFHVHAQYSPDADDLLPLKVRAFAGEGVEVPISTEHEFIGDFGPAAAAQGLTPFMHTIAGTELTTSGSGHFNIFPLTPIATALNAGGFNWYNKTIPDVIAEARTRLTATGEAPIVQMNHPRTVGMAYLDWIHFDPNNFIAPVNGSDFMTTWDAMEVWNGVPLANFEGCLGDTSCTAPSHPTAFDWFSFLDRAKFVTGTGNSDSHNASLREVGYPRNYLQIGTDDPSQVTDAQITAALRASKVTISGGPFLTISAPGGGIGDTVQPDFSTGSPVVHLTVRVQAPAWMGALQRADIWMGDTSAQGAHIVKPIDLTGAPVVDGLRFGGSVDIPISPAVDTWLIATVRGGGSHALWPVVQLDVPPYAITNPIWIDADGKPGITPLRLP